MLSWCCDRIPRSINLLCMCCCSNRNNTYSVYIHCYKFGSARYRKIDSHKKRKVPVTVPCSVMDIDSCTPSASLLHCNVWSGAYYESIGERGEGPPPFPYHLPKQVVLNSHHAYVPKLDASILKALKKTP